MGYLKIVFGFIAILSVEIPKEDPIGGLIVFLLILWLIITGIEDIVKENVNERP